MTNQLIYLAQKYTGREAESLAEAMTYKWKLEAKGFRVFSPIINSAFEDWCKNPEFIKGMNIDLNYKGGMSDKNTDIICRFVEIMDDQMPMRSELDYLAWDLQFLADHLKNDGSICVAWKSDCWYGDCSNCKDVNPKFDSGIVVAFCPSCFHYGNHIKDYAWYEMNDGSDKKIYNKDLPENIFDSEIKDGPFYDREMIWDSKGAKAEYDFCRAHYIECVLVDPLLEGKRERI